MAARFFLTKSPGAILDVRKHGPAGAQRMDALRISFRHKLSPGLIPNCPQKYLIFM